MENNRLKGLVAGVKGWGEVCDLNLFAGKEQAVYFCGLGDHRQDNGIFAGN